MRVRTSVGESDTRRSLGGWVWALVAVWSAGVALAASSVGAAQSADTARGRRSVTSPGTVARHDHPLRAVQLLEYRPSGSDARVRFEWMQVPGAREYRLTGRWTGTVSWVVKMREYRVNARSATTWTSQRVTLEVPLPQGNHSWRLFVVYGPNEARIVGDSTPLSFAVK